jgi:hypothetical protein
MTPSGLLRPNTGQNSGNKIGETISSAQNPDISVDLPSNSNFGAFGSGAGIGDANALMNNKHRMDF